MKLWANILLVIAMCGVMNSASAEAPYNLLDSAHSAYAKSNYAKAITFYSKFEESGYISEQEYYNLGNCYYRTGEIAKAILYYEKAKKLNPSDADVQFNLQLANLKTTDKINGGNTIFLVNWWNSFVNSFTEKGWAIICIALLFLAVLLFVLYNISGSLAMRQLGFWGGLVMAIFSLCSFAFARDQYNTLSSHDTGIVMSASVTVKGAPDEKATQLFVLHEGTKIAIVKTEGEWTEIRLPSGSQGWLLASDISPI
jgi:tetratricopeptide (TPR) repeat protein